MDVVVIVGDKGTTRVERSMEGGREFFVVSHPGRRCEFMDRTYALEVARHFAKYGEEGMVA